MVVAKGDALLLQRLSAPSWREFDNLIREARRQAHAAGLTTRDVKRAIAAVRDAP